MKTNQGGVLDALPAMAWTALPDGSLDLINRRWCDYCGLRSNEGRSRDWQALVHPDDLTGLLENWRSIIASGEAGEMKARVRRADGQYRSFLIQCSPIHDQAGQASGWCGVATDVDDTRPAAETLAQPAFDFQLIVDSIPMPVAVTTPSGEVEALNQATLDYFGKTLEELKDWKASEVVHPDDLERTVAEQIAAHQNGNSYHVESRHRRADGVYRWFSVHGLPLRDEPGNILRWLHLLIDVEDRKRAEEALRDSELKARAIIDGIPGFVAIITPDGKTDVVNQQMAEYHGLAPAELRRWATNRTIHDEDLPGVTEIFNRAIDSSTPYEIEYRLRRFDGVYRWFYSRGVPLRDASGRIICWYALQIDIDDRKKIEEALHESERNARLIVDSIPARVGIYDTNGIRVSANKQALELSGYTIGTDWREIFHPDDRERAENLWRASLASEQPFECEYRARMADGTYRWHIGRRVPMRDDTGKVIRWYGVSHDIEDRKRAEHALAASERNLQATIDSIPVRVGIYNPDGANVYVNKRTLELSGQPSGTDFRHLFHPDDLPLVDKVWDECLASEEPFECEYRAIMADGTYRRHVGRRVPMRDETGKVIRWYGVTSDIEDLKRAEEALQESERELRQIVDSIPARVGVYDANGMRLYVNKSAVELGGETFDWRHVYHPDDLGPAEKLWRHCLEREEPFELEYRARDADGTYRWRSERRVPMRGDNGNVVRWYGVSHDVEDQKRAEQALTESEHNLQLIIDTIPALAWSARLDGSAEFLSKHYLAYIGLTAEEALGWGWAAAIHAEDAEGLAATWQAIIASGEPGETEARMRRHDGEYRWFLFRANPLHDQQGHIIRWYGINTDIEDRKRSEEGFRAIVETTPECVKVVSRDGIVLRTNAAGAIMAGLPSPDDVVGQRFFDFVAPEHQTQYREFHEKVCAGQRGFLEFDLLNAQGIRRHMETHAAPLRESDGSIVQLGVTRDMTARKRAEDALRRSEAFLAEGQHLARMGNLSWNVTSGEIIWSEQLYRIFEFEPANAVTLDQIASRVHPEDTPLIDDMVERALRGERDFEYQLRIVLPDQSVKYLHLIAHRAGCHSNDGVIEYIGAVLDITQRRLSEEAVEKLRSELAQVTRIMSLGALTASIAHEVNQPLAGIITNAGTCLRMLAADPPNVEGAQETARRTIRDGKRAADVIARLRALFAKRAVTLEPVDLNDATREVIALLSTDLQRSRVILRTELAHKLPLVAGDRVQLQQVMMNLIRNAADAMSTVNDRTRHMLVSTARDEDGHVRLSVSDAGIGFGVEGAEKLFEAFYTTKADGMGIGLSVSRSIIEKHDGRLWAQANDGPGVTFTFSIPSSADAISVHHPAAEALTLTSFQRFS